MSTKRASSIGSKRASNAGSGKASHVSSVPKRASNIGSKRPSKAGSGKVSRVSSVPASNIGSKTASNIGSKRASNAGSGKASHVSSVPASNIGSKRASNIGSKRASNAGSGKVSHVSSVPPSNIGSKRSSHDHSVRRNDVGSRKASNINSKQARKVSSTRASNVGSANANNLISQGVSDLLESADLVHDGNPEDQQNEDPNSGNYTPCHEIKQNLIEIRRRVKIYENPCDISPRELTISSQDDAADKIVNHQALLSSVQRVLTNCEFTNKLAQNISHPVRELDDDLQLDAPIRGLKGINSTLDTLNDGLKYWLNIAKDHHYQEVSASKRVSYGNSPDPDYAKRFANGLKQFSANAAEMERQKWKEKKQREQKFTFDQMDDEMEKEKPPKKEKNEKEEPPKEEPPKEEEKKSLMDAVGEFHPDDPQGIQMGFVCMVIQDVELLNMAGDEDTGNGELLPATSIIEVAAVERVNGVQFAKITNPVKGWIRCHDKTGIPNLPAAVRAAGKNAFICLGADSDNMDARIKISRMDDEKWCHEPRKRVLMLT